MKVSSGHLTVRKPPAALHSRPASGCSPASFAGPGISWARTTTRFRVCGPSVRQIKCLHSARCCTASQSARYRGWPPVSAHHHLCGTRRYPSRQTFFLQLYLKTLDIIKNRIQGPAEERAAKFWPSKEVEPRKLPFVDQSKLLRYKSITTPETLA